MNDGDFNATSGELAEVIRMIRPLPPEIQPSATFVDETRAMLEETTIVSLSSRRLQREQERQRRNGRSAA